LIRLLLADAIAIEMLFAPGAIFVCAFKELCAHEMINNNDKSKRDTFIILKSNNANNQSRFENQA
jgi:hypothetical protein